MGVKELKRRLKELMIEGETQVNFARRAGVAQSTISRIFSGQLPKISVLNRIADNMGISANYLLDALASPDGESQALKQRAASLDLPENQLEFFPKNMAPVSDLQKCLLI